MSTSPAGDCVLAVSIQDFSNLLSGDEQAAVNLLDEYEELLEAAAADHGGRIARRSGDEALVLFSSARNAVEAAAGLDEHRRRRWSRTLRMGIAAGSGPEEPGARAAMRLQAVAPPGTVGVTAAVLEAVRAGLDVVSVSLGELHLGGDELSAPAFALRLGPASAAGAANEAVAGAAGAAANEAGPAGDRELPPSMYPSRRGFGDEAADREAERAWDQALEVPHHGPGGAPDPLIEEYAEQTTEAAEQASAGFRGHAASFAAVNAGLAGIWFWTAGAGGFPWFLIPLFGWGIGLASHYDAVRRRKLEVRELDELPIETREQLRTYRQYAKARGAWRGHLVSTAATSVLLFTINMITYGGFPWFLFPVGGMGIGLVSHYPRYRAKAGRLLNRLRELAVPGATANADRRLDRQRTRPGRAERGGRGGDGARENGTRPRGARRDETRRSATRPAAGTRPATGAGEAEGVVGEAEVLRADILDAADESVGLDRSSFESVLDEYLARIRQLAAARDELLASGGPADLEQTQAELRELREKESAASDDKLRAEYATSITQAEKRRRSYEELLRDEEILEVRLRSAVNMLKQMRVDVARMRGVQAAGGADRLGEIRERTEELSTYLSDLRRAYDELD